MAIPHKHASHKVAVITGASSGFGLLLSIKLATLGWVVYAGYRDEAKRGGLQAAAEQAGVQARIRPIALDVTESAQIHAAADRILAEVGGLDALINNAGYAIGGFVEEVPLAAWRAQFETNLFGVVAVTQAMLPLLRLRTGGRIVLLSSVSGKIGFPTLAPYAASKHALEGLGESLRLELAPFGIAVSLVLPGPYRTAIWDKGLTGGAAPASGSPYLDYYARVMPQVQKSGERGGDPAIVVRTILRALTDEQPRLRYLPSWSERMTLGMKRYLPWRLIERSVLKSLGMRKGNP